MAVAEIGLVARAVGVAGRLATRETLEALADAADLDAFARALPGRVALDPLGSPPDVLAIERAIGRAGERYLRTLYRWQARSPGVLDVFAARQDRRSLRALVRGAVQGVSSERRLDGLVPTPSLPRLTLAGLARQAAPAGVVSQLVLLSHPAAAGLAPLVRASRVDLRAIEVALLQGFAARASVAAAATGDAVRRFVAESIDAGNVENALLVASEPRDAVAGDVFVPGGRWLDRATFDAVSRAGSAGHALERLGPALSRTPLAPLLPGAGPGAAQVDRAFLVSTLGWVARAARLAPLSAAPLLRVLLLIEAQGRDLRTLGWGAALGTPSSARRQQLLTPP